jgi:small subunit ribosomal protein S18
MAVKRAPSKKVRAEAGRRPKKNPLNAAKLTPQQQRQVAVAVKNAREMALLPFTSR